MRDRAKMGMGGRLGALVAVIAVAGACASAATTPVPTTTAATGSSPSAAVATSAPPSQAAASPTAAASTAAAAIPDGTYVTDPIPAATVIAAINGSKLSATDKQGLIGDGFGLGNGSKTVAFKVTFADGSFSQSESVDGGAFEVGSKGSFAFPDDHTLTLQETCCLTSYAIAWTGPALSLALRSDSTWTGNIADDIAPAIVYGGAPFHAQS